MRQLAKQVSHPGLQGVFAATETKCRAPAHFSSEIHHLVLTEQEWDDECRVVLLCFHSLLQLQCQILTSLRLSAWIFFLCLVLEGPQVACILVHCPLLAAKEITAALVWTSAAFAVVALWFTSHATSGKCSLVSVIFFIEFFL